MKPSGKYRGESTPRDCLRSEESAVSSESSEDDLRAEVSTKAKSTGEGQAAFGKRINTVLSSSELEQGVKNKGT